MTARPSAAGICPTLWLTSFSALSLEIILARSFSIILWHHLIFMIISIALLGYGASGSLLALFPTVKNRADEAWTLLLFLFPLTILAASWTAFSLPFDPVNLLWNPFSFLKLSLYYLVLSLPFFNAGLIMSLGYALHPRSSSILYLFDLTGGAAGSLMGPFIFAASRGMGVPLVAIIASLGPLLYPGRNRLRRFLSFALLATFASWAFFGTDVFLPEPNPYKGLPAALRYQGSRIIDTRYDLISRVDIAFSPASRGAPGLSLHYRGAPLKTVGASVDGGTLIPLPLSDSENAGMLSYLPSYLPYYLAPKRRVLLEDSRGGIPLYMAAEAGVSDIVSAEPYPLSKALFRQSLPDDSRWLDRPGLSFTRGWIRNHLSGGGKSFDLIDLHLTTIIGAASTGMMPAREDYRLTREAMEIYLDHLAPDGMIMITTFILPPPRTEARLMATAVERMENRYGEGFTKHLFSFRSFNTISILLKESPLTPTEIERARLFCQERGFDLVFHYGLNEAEANRFNVFPEPFYHRLISSLLERETREEVYRKSVFDIRPVTDERPFFFGFVRFGMLKASIRSLGGHLLPLLQSGLLIWLILLQAGLISLVIILLPLIPRFPEAGNRAPVLLYFSVIGLAYMLLEVSWIQKFTLATGSPSTAASLIIAVFLFSSGMGSLVSRWIKAGGRYSLYSIMAAGAAASFFTLVLHHLVGQSSPFLLNHPYPAAVILGAPAAFLMGFPFPLGLRLLGESSSRQVPWAWGINGCLSVMGAVAAPALAWQVGYLATALLGGILYLVAAVLLSRLSG
jgi:hypothetical protein